MEKQCFSIGWAFADISTTEPISIPGQFYMRFSKGILDPVTATAMWISDGKDDVCFLSIDMVIVCGGLTDEVQAEVAKRNPAIPVKKIILNATHTHAGPGYFPDYVTNAEGAELKGDVPVPTYRKIADGLEYRKFLVGKLVDIVCEAYDKRANGAIAYGYGYAVVGHSRRVLYHDDVSKRPGAVHNSTHGVNGHAVMYGPTNDDKFSGYEGGADSFVNLLYTFDEKGKLTGVIVNVPCPSQNSEEIWYLSASFWHDTREAIRKKFGDIFIMAQSAAGGDLSPRQLHYHAAEYRRYALKYGKPENYPEEFRRKDIAERIAASVEEVYSWAKNDLITYAPIHHEVLELQLSRRMITQEDYDISCKRLKELNERSFQPEVKGQDNTDVFRANYMLVAERYGCKGIIRRWEEQQKTAKYATQSHVLSIGDIAFATNQFELYIDFQHRIQGRSPFTQTFIIQLAGVTGQGGGTYLATKRGFLNRGYSASRYCNLVSWKGGNELVEKTLKALKKLWDKDHKAGKA